MQPIHLIPANHADMIAIQPINLAVISKYLPRFRQLEDQLLPLNIHLQFASKRIKEGSSLLPLDEINMLAIDLYWPSGQQYLFQSLWALKIVTNVKVIGITRVDNVHTELLKGMGIDDLICYPFSDQKIIQCFSKASKTISCY